jgi:hypothetical protein
MDIRWLAKPEEKDYPAATSYLSLHLSSKLAAATSLALRGSQMTAFAAKDIFRASGLNLLGVSNSHVKKNLEKIKAGKELSPVLLARHKGRLFIADGYHRLCAVYTYDEDAMIPCKIVCV